MRQQDNDNVIIRTAALQDAERLLEIYSYYVRSTAVSFEYTVPSVEEFRARMDRILEMYPWLVLEEHGTVCGYVYAGVFKGRAAYDHSCETSIYVDHTAKRRGYGRKLYGALEERLLDMDIFNMYACISSPVTEDIYLTRDSERFHEHLGFTKVGTFHQCGYKFHRWYNMIWMEKMIGDRQLWNTRTDN